MKKSRSDEKVAAAPRGGRRTAIAVSKATSVAGGGRYSQFFNGLLRERTLHCLRFDPNRQIQV